MKHYIKEDSKFMYHVYYLL